MSKTKELILLKTEQVLLDGLYFSIAESILNKEITIENFPQDISSSGIYHLVIEDRLKCLLNDLFIRVAPQCENKLRVEDKYALNVLGDLLGFSMAFSLTNKIFNSNNGFQAKKLLAYLSVKLTFEYLNSGKLSKCLICPPKPEM